MISLITFEELKSMFELDMNFPCQTRIYTFCHSMFIFWTYYRTALSNRYDNYLFIFFHFIVCVCVCVCVSVCVCLCVCLSVRPFVRSFVRSFVRPSVRPSVCLSVCLSLCVGVKFTGPSIPLQVSFLATILSRGKQLN